MGEIYDGEYPAGLDAFLRRQPPWLAKAPAFHFDNLSHPGENDLPCRPEILFKTPSHKGLEIDSCHVRTEKMRLSELYFGPENKVARVKITATGTTTSDVTDGTVDDDANGTLDFNGATIADVDVVVKDDGTIGSASKTDAITIASDGKATFASDIVIKDGGTIGSASKTDAIAIASDGKATFADDIVIKDGGTIGSASKTDAIAIASDGKVTFADDIVIKDGGTIGVASDPGGGVQVYGAGVGVNDYDSINRAFFAFNSTEDPVYGERYSLLLKRDNPQKTRDYPDDTIKFPEQTGVVQLDTLPLKTVDGSESSPSITFGSDTNTGMYRAGADRLGFSVNGSQVALFQDQDPCVSFTGDSSWSKFQWISPYNPGSVQHQFGDNSDFDRFRWLYQNSSDTAFFSINGTWRFKINTYTIQPYTHASMNLGTSSVKWDDVYCVNLTEGSDARLKKNVSDTKFGLDFVNTLRPVEYVWKDKGVRRHLGFIAQEVKESLDAAASSSDYALWWDASVKEGEEKVAVADGDGESYTRTNDTQGLRPTELISVLTKAVQELDAKNRALEARLLALESKEATWGGAGQQKRKFADV